MTMEMIKFVEDLRNIYKGKTIWVVGTGKSIDDFSEEYFNNKVFIVLNGAVYKYKNPTFWHGHHELWRIHLRDKRPDLLEKAIIPFPFPGPFVEKPVARQPVEFFKEKTSLPYWLYFKDVRPAKKENLEITIKQIVENKKRIDFYAAMTVAHLAVEAAFLMGAKKIVLVGCEHKNFEKAPSHGDVGMKYPAQFPADKNIADATTHLAKILAEQDVELVRYYNKNTEFYKKGYEEIK